MLGFMTHQPLWVILCRLPEKGRKQIEEIVEEIKWGTGKKEEQEIKWRTRTNKSTPLYPYLLQGQQALPNCKSISVGRPGLTISKYKTCHAIYGVEHQMVCIMQTTYRVLLIGLLTQNGLPNTRLVLHATNVLTDVPNSWSTHYKPHIACSW